MFQNNDIMIFLTQYVHVTKCLSNTNYEWKPNQTVLNKFLDGDAIKPLQSNLNLSMHAQLCLDGIHLGNISYQKQGGPI